MCLYVGAEKLDVPIDTRSCVRWWFNANRFNARMDFINVANHNPNPSHGFITPAIIDLCASACECVRRGRSEAELTSDENIKQVARNVVSLFFLFFAVALWWATRHARPEHEN